MSSRYPPLTKSRPFGVVPNLSDYSSARESFTWAAARGELDGLPGGGLNMAYEAVDRHVIRGRGEHLAIRWLGKNGEVRDLSYRTLMDQTNRFANVLRGLGIGRGDRGAVRYLASKLDHA